MKVELLFIIIKVIPTYSKIHNLNPNKVVIAMHLHIQYILGV